MPAAITAIFGADSRPLDKELRRIESVAGISGARMGAQFASGFGHGGPGGGISGIMRETLVIFRELGRGNFTRIPGSATLLFQYLGGLGTLLKSTAAEAVKSAESEANLAKKFSATAIVLRDKAEASKAAIIASNLDGGASLRQALADNIAAKAAKDNATAQILKAEASERAASIQLATAKTSFTPFGLVLFGIAAAFVALYAIYKVFSAFRNRAIREQQIEAEIALKLKLNYEEQADAMKKLRDATEKTADAIAKLNDKQNDSVKKSSDAIEAIKQQAKAAQDLADAKNKGAVLDIELQEKIGKISHDEAIKRKADLEKQEIAAKSKAKLEELYNVMYAAGGADVAAQAQAKSDALAAQAASDKVNSTPEGIANALELAKMEKIRKENLDEAVEYQKKSVESSTAHDRIYNSNLASIKNSISGIFDQKIEFLKSQMKPDELAAAAALTKAQQSSEAARSLAETHSKAVTEYVNAKNAAPQQIAAEQENIDKQAQLDLMRDRVGGGFSLNSQQRIGAYATTPPDWSVLLMNVKGIHENTKHLQPNPNAPPGSRPPQFGSRSHR